MMMTKIIMFHNKDNHRTINLKTIPICLKVTTLKTTPICKVIITHQHFTKVQIIPQSSLKIIRLKVVKTCFQYLLGF